MILCSVLCLAFNQSVVHLQRPVIPSYPHTTFTFKVITTEAHGYRKCHQVLGNGFLVVYIFLKGKQQKLSLSPRTAASKVLKKTDDR